MNDIDLFYKYIKDAHCVHNITFMHCHECLKEMIRLYNISRL